MNERLTLAHHFVVILLFSLKVEAFSPPSCSNILKLHKTSFVRSFSSSSHPSSTSLSSKNQEWTGEVVSNTENGAIRGCAITQVPDSLTTWTIAIDGVEADLGKFSEAIYRKITQDAKQQRFQGFRPGTIPPHLQPTYKAFAMDEAAREATLEAMEQNNIRPFEDSRNEILIENVSIPPATKSKKGKKKKGGKKRNKKPLDDSVAELKDDENEEKVEDVWLTFPTMKEAIDAGWKPGQSFSFISKNVKGQKIEVGSVTSTGSPVGAGGSAFDLNAVAAQVASDAAENK